MAVAPGGYVDHWYVFARREWPDGMQLEACSNSTISYTDDGGMVVDLVDDDGNGAIFVVDPDAAKVLHAIHESIFTGVGVMHMGMSV